MLWTTENISHQSSTCILSTTLTTQNISHQSSACTLSTTLTSNSPSKGLSQKGVQWSSHRRDTQYLECWSQKKEFGNKFECRAFSFNVSIALCKHFQPFGTTQSSICISQLSRYLPSPTGFFYFPFCSFFLSSLFFLSCPLNPYFCRLHQEFSSRARGFTSSA
jgi:hypothetical protein